MDHLIERLLAAEKEARAIVEAARGEAARILAERRVEIAELERRAATDLEAEARVLVERWNEEAQGRKRGALARAEIELDKSAALLEAHLAEQRDRVVTILAYPTDKSEWE